jgi:hypothetical protein
MINPRRTKQSKIVIVCYGFAFPHMRYLFISFLLIVINEMHSHMQITTPMSHIWVDFCLNEVYYDVRVVTCQTK